MRTLLSGVMSVLLLASISAERAIPQNPRAAGAESADAAARYDSTKATHLKAADLVAAVSKLATGRNGSAIFLEQAASSPGMLDYYRIGLDHRPATTQIARVHEVESEFWYVRGGSATVVTGGRIIDGRIQGGVSQPVTAGDFIMIPNGIPHQLTDIQGTITIVNYEFPRSPLATSEGGTPESVDAARRYNAAKATYLSSADIAAAVATGQPRDARRVHPVLFEQPGTAYYRAGLDHQLQGTTAAVHEMESELWFVVDGNASVTTGGTLMNPKQSANRTSWSGSGIRGGTTYELAKGDFLKIPNGVAHQSVPHPTVTLVTFEIPRPPVPQKY